MTLLTCFKGRLRDLRAHLLRALSADLPPCPRRSADGSPCLHLDDGHAECIGADGVTFRGTP